LKQQIEELRARAGKELERRVGVAVENALASANSQSEDSKQQALTALRVTFNEERERANRLLQDNFNNRLQEEVKSAYEMGRQNGHRDGSKATDPVYIQQRQTEFETLKQSLEREIENQNKTIALLESNISTPAIPYSLEQLSRIVKEIVKNL